MFVNDLRLAKYDFKQDEIETIHNSQLVGPSPVSNLYFMQSRSKSGKDYALSLYQLDSRKDCGPRKEAHRQGTTPVSRYQTRNQLLESLRPGTAHRCDRISSRRRQKQSDCNVRRGALPAVQGWCSEKPCEHIKFLPTG